MFQHLILKMQEIVSNHPEKDITPFLKKIPVSEKLNTFLFLSTNVKVLDYLASIGADVNAKDTNGDTLLHLTSDTKKMSWLLANGASVNAQNNEGLTPLHTASDVKNTEILLAYGARPEIKDNQGRTPLFYAKSCQQIFSLIRAGNSLDNRDKYGRTPLFYVTTQEQTWEMLELARRSGKEDVLNIQDNNGLTPLMFVKDLALKKILLQGTPDLELEDKKGETVLFYAENPTEAKLYLNAGADLYHVNKAGHTPVSKILTGKRHTPQDYELIKFYKTQRFVSQKVTAYRRFVSSRFMTCQNERG